MTVKYTREHPGQREGARRETPFKRTMAPRRMPQRQRAASIMMGVLAFVALVLLTLFPAEESPFLRQPKVHGEGTVLSISPPQPGEGPACTLQIRVFLPSGKSAEAAAQLDGEFCGAFGEGDRVGIIYQQSKDKERIRILECGLAPL